MAHKRGTVVNLHKASGSGSIRPKQDDGHNGPTHSLPSLTNPVFNADHVLVAAENGVVYVIWQDPSTARTTVWMHSTGRQGGFIKASDSILFRRTSKPFISSSSTLYVGGKTLPGQKPAVYVWKAKNLIGILESPRAVATNWEYTVLAQSSTGRVLYCGCSDGAIEVWKHVDSNQPRVYDHHLTGHGGHGICELAVGNDGILISVDKQDRNIVRVWRTQQQVVKLDLKLLQVSRLACTMDCNLYIITRGEHPTRYWCNVKNSWILQQRVVKPAAQCMVWRYFQNCKIQALIPTMRSLVLWRMEPLGRCISFLPGRSRKYMLLKNGVAMSMFQK